MNSDRATFGTGGGVPRAPFGTKLLAAFFGLVCAGAGLIGIGGNPLSIVVAAIAGFAAYALWNNRIWGAAAAGVLMLGSIVEGSLELLGGEISGVITVVIAAAICWYLYSIRRSFRAA